MPQTALQEGMHTGEYLKSEANGARSRGVGVIASGENLSACTVLGKITANGQYTQLDTGASDGSEVAASILWAAVDATDAAVDGAVMHVRDCEVNGDDLVWPDGFSQGEIDTAIGELADVGIIVR